MAFSPYVNYFAPDEHYKIMPKLIADRLVLFLFASFLYCSTTTLYHNCVVNAVSSRCWILLIFIYIADSYAEKLYVVFVDVAVTSMR